jgi:hypothetical protein
LPSLANLDAIALSPAGQSHLIVFFVIMQCKRLFQFKAQWRWLTQHPDARQQLGFKTLPTRTTLSRRYKALYDVVRAFIAFLGQHSADLGPAFDHQHLYEDKSLFQAQGPVWHQSDRQAGHIPANLRHVDTDATWSKSAYHGWVYGYGLHLTCNQAGFPILAQVETAAVSESQVLDDQEPQIVKALSPDTLSGDNSYTQVRRIRHWAEQGVVLLTPALKWVGSRYAKGYHRFIQQAENVARLKARRTTIEPSFDLIAKLLGANGWQKLLPLQRLANVRTCLALAVLTLQVVMIANSIWGLPLREVSHILTVFT